MTDKNKIIAEVERLKNDLTEAPNQSEIDLGRISAFEDILLYIDSLSEEPVSYALNKAANMYSFSRSMEIETIDRLKDAFISVPLKLGRVKY